MQSRKTSPRRGRRHPPRQTERPAQGRLHFSGRQQTLGLHSSRTQTAAMARIPAGTFLMGLDNHHPEEAPAHRVTVSGFRMDVTAATSRQYAAFFQDTGYVTVAERPLDPALYPGMPHDRLVPGSTVSHMRSGPVDLRDVRQWWRWVPGASCRHPQGSGSSIKKNRASFRRSRRVRGRTGLCIRGGSFLCAPCYCRRYRPAARHPPMIETGTSHIGFRCIIRG